MSLIVLTSASGSPGATVTALGLALAWPRPVVLVDADPTGALAIPAGYLHGAELPTDRTIVDLAMSHRHGTLETDLPRALMTLPRSKVQYLRGPLGHAQARALGGLWEPLATVLKSLERNGQDVIVDAGRLGLEGSPAGLISGADLTLLAARSNLPAQIAAKDWSGTLRDMCEAGEHLNNLGAVLIGPGEPFGAKEVAKVLQIPVVATVAWDEPSAAVFSLGKDPGRRFNASKLCKSLRASVQAIQSTLAASRANLRVEMPEGSTP